MCYARRQRSSWARIKLSKSFYLISGLPELKSSFELFILASFTLLSIYNSIDEISISHLQFCFVLISCCSIFNDRSLPFPRQPQYYTTSLSCCQYFFEKFLRFFQSFFVLFSSAALSWTAWLFYHLCPLLSIPFFNFFWPFGVFVKYDYRFYKICPVRLLVLAQQTSKYTDFYKKSG